MEGRSVPGREASVQIPQNQRQRYHPGACSVSLGSKTRSSTGKAQGRVTHRGWVITLTCVVSPWKVVSRQGTELGSRTSCLVGIQEMDQKETAWKHEHGSESWLTCSVQAFEEMLIFHLPLDTVFQAAPGSRHSEYDHIINQKPSGTLIPSHVFPLTHGPPWHIQKSKGSLICQESCQKRKTI